MVYCICRPIVSRAFRRLAASMAIVPSNVERFVAKRMAEPFNEVDKPDAEWVDYEESAMSYADITVLKSMVDWVKSYKADWKVEQRSIPGVPIAASALPTFANASDEIVVTNQAAAMTVNFEKATNNTQPKGLLGRLRSSYKKHLGKRLEKHGHMVGNHLAYYLAVAV